MRVMPMLADANFNGEIFGGWVMSQADLAASVIPARYITGRMTTVAVTDFLFKHPVRVSDIVTFYADIFRVGRTSITVDVEIYVEKFREQGRHIKVSEARFTYVAIDDAGTPCLIQKRPEE